MSECTVLGLKENLSRNDTTLVDVREFPEFAGGRVPGARLIPLGEIEKRHQEINRDHTVYVICRSGKRGGEAQKKLKALGFANVVNVAGGTEAWKAANLPIESKALVIWRIVSPCEWQFTPFTWHPAKA